MFHKQTNNYLVLLYISRDLEIEIQTFQVMPNILSGIETLILPDFEGHIINVNWIQQGITLCKLETTAFFRAIECRP